MDLQPVIHDTFVLERSYPVSPERVFSYFTDAARKRRWFGESDGHDVEAFELDFRVGGVANEGTIQEIAPGRRVVTATTMTLGDRRISSALVTIEIVPDGDGARLTCTHQAAFYEGADGPQMRKGGWEQLFARLARTMAD
jgi:uncharacterized protein YndB with AHSA1/START domain